jgi:hypothetical protein
MFSDQAPQIELETPFPPPIPMDGNGVLPPDEVSIRSLRAAISRPVDTTNVVRVAFGLRRARRPRPARPDHWATLVLPLQAGRGGLPPMPPHAA